MTTIAYSHRDKEIAYDSRSTRGGLIKTDEAVKIHCREGVTFFITGVVPDQDLMMDYYFGRKDDTYPECNCFAVDGGELYFCGVTESCEFWKESVYFDSAMGSGESFALAAMDFGKTAKESVEYAMTRDCKTGGKVHVFKVE